MSVDNNLLISIDSENGYIRENSHANSIYKFTQIDPFLASMMLF
ncbi:hypothetical protein ADIARSV_1854 [Arcticibacter svalbardensis MN12-7]|uniref:Uncharacterized protein n=1 Tax=Arcticibacter svalbardensis MN12-7 TaxID=1150600 RepID=R9GTG0_9SPHI|nr:hypothetical protein ADIARSV_1854 [Arcticibacter svalbardensis MN12-7]